MSQGSFTSSQYEADSGDLHLIVVQPETLEATFDGTANAAPEGDINSPFAAEVNRGAREYGLRPRKVNVAFTDSPPTGYRPYTTLSIAVLDPAVFDGASIGDAVAYNGGTGVISSKVAENIRPGEAVVSTSEPAPAPTP